MRATSSPPKVELSYPDLVIHVGKMTLGEANRKALQSDQRRKERETIIQAACALLNSGGGVIMMEMTNQDKDSMGIHLDLEKPFRDLIQSSDLETFFETKQQEKYFYVFVKSWSRGPFPAAGPSKPRICSQSCHLYRRSATSAIPIDSREAFEFLNIKTKVKQNNEGYPPSKMPRTVHQSSPKLEEKYEYGDILPVYESSFVEFKQFSTENIEKYIKDTIPKYTSAFANASGGSLFIGVEDKERRILSCPKDNVDCASLERIIAEAISKLPVVHFCSSAAQVSFRTKFIDVFRQGNLYGYLCVVIVEPFCCVAFSKAPHSWMVDKERGIYSLTAKEWVDQMTEADPEAPDQPSSPRSLSEAFQCQLSLSNSPPRCRPVYSRKGLEHKTDLQKHFFPVPPDDLLHTPESLWEELSSQHEGLKKLLGQQTQSSSCGVLILSRSWAVDLGLEEHQGVICDALLIAKNSLPTLYTVLAEQHAGAQDYCTRTAFTLKQKLVNTGGYTERVCVMTKILCLGPVSQTESAETSVSPIAYPRSYYLADTQQMETLLQALVIVLLSFRSFLSDQLGCEILNLLTAQQYELFSKNLRKNRLLHVHGFPGSGKTIIAMKIMEKIRNVFHCETNRILYICENQRLKDFISAKRICQAVTRKSFMKYDFKEVQHIIIDEAQNFRTEDGDWYGKAKNITHREGGCPGILWVFLDYYQTSHLGISGLPPLNCQFPREELTKMVRNADKIAEYLQKVMQDVREDPPPNIPSGSLELLPELDWAQGVAGTFQIKYLDWEEMVSYVAEECQFFVRNGYSPKDIAVLFSTANDVEACKNEFLQEMRKRKASQTNDASSIYTYDMFDSIRRFSGLERSIVFGIDPWAAESAISHNLLLCLASRAVKHLYILKCPQSLPFMF